jgi:CheY-like chemotaxis protein
LPRILFADDGLTIMKLSGALLDDPDLILDTATDGRSALNRVSDLAGKYDLVVLGHTIPEIPAAECVRFLKQMFRRLPVLILGEVDDPARYDELAELGISRDRILSPNSDPETFATWVREALARAASQRPPDTP